MACISLCGLSIPRKCSAPCRAQGALSTACINCPGQRLDTELGKRALEGKSRSKFPIRPLRGAVCLAEFQPQFPHLGRGDDDGEVRVGGDGPQAAYALGSMHTQCWLTAPVHRRPCSGMLPSLAKEPGTGRASFCPSGLAIFPPAGKLAQNGRRCSLTQASTLTWPPGPSMDAAPQGPSTDVAP